MMTGLAVRLLHCAKMRRSKAFRHFVAAHRLPVK
jgi:hypothetical protein